MSFFELHFELAGVGAAPRTKKNHGRTKTVRYRGRRVPKRIPSLAHETWYNAVLPRANQQASDYREQFPGLLPLSSPVNVAATFYRQANTGDAVGYYQALADLLQTAQIVLDDKYIVAWDGSRMRKDARRPRIELVITAAEDE
jgi:hypothetical protein